MTASARRFEGHGVMVTGAGRGIGAATARRFAAEGARVLVTDVDADSAERLAAELRDTGAVAEGMRCDVSQRADAEGAVERAVGSFGSLDVLVNNAFAAADEPGRIEELSDEEWALGLDVTLTGAFRCARAAMASLEASGRGAIVNVGSVNGLQDFGGHAYSAAKAGLVSLTRTLAGHGAGRGVRANLVAPGTVRTPAWSERGDDVDRFSRLYPLGRVGEPADVAAAVAFLASADAGWITGVTLPVDGGILAVNMAFQRVAPHG
ncbi:SDR family NAD(P)-dependent oxidoreductase [Streptomyces sp. NPDC127068]|uniref:SDR family NAD(P)-dependent oxidoreductase n=1 Tax=Streptomyces sp. NPDC127068 TaxID=3347127 RepID=UPI003646485E